MLNNIELEGEYDCWVFPCVNSHAQAVFYTVFAKKNQFILDEVFDDIVRCLRDQHGLEYVADGSPWAQGGESEFLFWPGGKESRKEEER